MSSFQKYILILIFSFFAFPMDAAESTSTLTGVMNQYPIEFYALLALSILELIIIGMLSKALLQALGYKREDRKEINPVKVPVHTKGILRRIVDYLVSDKGNEVDLKHDYDGISELDNRTPQWWTIAFIFTILIALVYSYRTFVSGTMPDQITELNAEIALAKKTKINQLSSINEEIDENSVVLLDEDNKFRGGLIFSANCVACHGQNGEGNVVGPNLTDDYWLHNGNVKDIFYSIKYGYVEKGMKSWQNDFSPLQMAQLATYVKSLIGTNPPNARPKQGELYIDSTSMLKDSTISIKKL